MKTYLITGCAGFIGSNFVHYMLKKYPEILLVNLDKLTYAGNLENLKDVEGDPRHVFVQGDICDKELVESLFAKYDFDYVINFAAESHVDRSIKNPEIFVQSNVMGTVNLLQRAKDLLAPAEFGKFSVTTAEEHDRMIAFTSQLAHVASNAYIKSPTAKKHKGFSAGSYKDMTRVAWLAPHMWAELFMENKEFLLKEIDCYIEHLSEYKTAMEHDDEETLIRLLDEGKKRKEEVDG